MTALGGNLTIEQRRQYVIASVSIGIILSTVSLIARLWARLLIINRLRVEDWLMVIGTLISYGTAACMLYAVIAADMSVPSGSLPPKKISQNLLIIWIIQKLQPPTILCIKASILVFHAHIFQSRRFRTVSWAVGTVTGLWMLATVLGTTFQCTPASFFWDRTQPGGYCLDAAIHKLGLPNGVISSISDIIIYVMPIPPLLKLRVERRTKLGLIGVFTVGLFAVIASILRWVVLIGSVSVSADNTSQVQVGIWTYLEMSVGITCGNMPFLAPMLGCVGPRKRSYYLAKVSRQRPSGGRELGNNASKRPELLLQEPSRKSTLRPLSRLPALPEIITGRGLDLNTNEQAHVQRGGFTRFYDSSDGSDIELGILEAVSEEEVAGGKLGDSQS